MRFASPLTISASVLVRTHTYLALSAFLSALLIASALHFKKIVKNGVAGYPEEWFPSVSATIGDWYPERSIFHILIALASGPRFAMVFLQYFLAQSSNSRLPLVVLVSGLARTLSCGGWVYITSEDDHDVHDVLMIVYIVCNIPWMFGTIACTPNGAVVAKRRRKMISATFFVSLIPMVYFYIMHKVYQIAGAYTRYAFFEWTLIFADVAFDAVNEIDFLSNRLEIMIRIPHRPEASRDVNSLSGSKTTTEVRVVAFEAPEKQGLNLQKEQTTGVAQTAKAVEQPGAPVNVRRWPLYSFASDVYLAYVFWSILTSLAPTLFYFSVWELGIAGHELALLSVLSPVLLGFSPFLEWARTKTGRTTLHVLSLTGMAAYKLNLPLHRLFVVGFATCVACIGKAVDWGQLHGDGYESIMLGLGLVMSSLSKHANHSNNPIWPFVNEHSGGYNKTGIVLAAISILEFGTRPGNNKSTLLLNLTNKLTQIERSKVPPWIAATSLGSLLFSLHCLLSDSSTLIAWSWTGYPIRGPVPHLHGALTLIAQCSGLLLAFGHHTPPLSSLRPLTHPAWFLFGSCSAYIMYCYKDWFGYSGGLGFTIFLMSIIPQVLQGAVASGKTASTFFCAWLVTVVLYLANVWTVAYAFVPGGVYLRERTDIVLIVQVSLLAPAFAWSKHGFVRQLPKVSPAAKAYSVMLLGIMSILSVLVTIFWIPITSPQPYNAGPRIINAGVWTLHFGIDNEGRDSQRRVRDLIKDMKLDIVGLLETDLHRTVFGNRDLTRVLVDELGYHVDIGPGPNQHTWGAVLLSKFPILRSTHHLLPSPNGELAPCISAVLDVWGSEVTVVVAHNGQEEDPVDRELQSQELARIMAATYPSPVIFLGYVVTKPHAPRPAPYEILVKDGLVHDIDSLDYDRWCEYIFFRGLYRTSYARLSRSTITDTELQVGQFVLPHFGYGVMDDSEPARYLRARKEDLPEAHWFPMDYYGNEREGGKNGHYYHVFYTPLYYKIPEGSVV